MENTQPSSGHYYPIQSRLVSFVSALLAPLLISQGRRVKTNTPRLPGASGHSHGTIGHNEQATLTLSFIGESTVAGVGVDSFQQSLTAQTAKTLQQLTKKTINWHALGKNGATAHYTRHYLLPELNLNSDIIVIVLGVNDTVAFKSPKHWQHEIETLITRIRQQSTAPIILAGVPNMRYFPNIPKPLSQILGWRAAILDKISIRIIEQYSRVYHHQAPQPDKKYFARDGYHPDAKGYQKWGENLATFIQNIL